MAKACKDRKPASVKAAELQAFRVQRPAYYTIRTAKQRAAQYGVEFDLDQHSREFDERFRGCCELTGIPFRQGVGPAAWNSPSIDRVRAGGPYTKNNVRVVLFAVNSAMGIGGEAVLEQIARAYIARKDSHE